MIDQVLGIVIIGLLGLLAWERHETRKEQSKLINALISKTPEQLRDLDFVDKVQPPKIEETKPEFVSPEQLSDEEWVEKVTGESVNA